jgi:hypothetical protein
MGFNTDYMAMGTVPMPVILCVCVCVCVCVFSPQTLRESTLLSTNLLK